MNYGRLMLFLVFPMFSAHLHAADARITSMDLVGKWVTEGKESCDSNASQYVHLHDNGIMELGRGTKPRTVGFWIVSENVITLHMLVAPSEDDDSNVFYKGRYSYSYLTAEVVDASEGAIEIITGTTGNIKRQTLTRCN